MADPLVHARQQMLMARPWHAAAPGSLWDITGAYPAGTGEFRRCLAVAVEAPVDESGASPLLFLLVPDVTGRNAVAPEWITSAVPLLLVHAEDPARPYEPAADELHVRRAGQPVRGSQGCES